MADISFDHPFVAWKRHAPQVVAAQQRGHHRHVVLAASSGWVGAVAAGALQWDGSCQQCSPIAIDATMRFAVLPIQ